VADLLVSIPPCARLSERLAACLAMADDPRSAKPEAMWMDSIHLDQAHPLIGITLADLGPGEWLRDHRGELLGGAHRPMVDALAFLSSSWRSLSNNLDQGRRSAHWCDEHDCEERNR
jgi:hypothetical protein